MKIRLPAKITPEIIAAVKAKLAEKERAAVHEFGRLVAEAKAAVDQNPPGLKPLPESR